MLAGVCFAIHLLLAISVHAQTLAHIRQSKVLRCGINIETPEYSSSDDHGPRQAFDADLCRAVAVAVLGSQTRVITTEYPDDVSAVAALRAGKVDLLPTLTLDLTHASRADLSFSPPVLYDGVGLLVPIAAHLSQPSDLSDKKICFLAETEVEVALRAWFLQQNLKFLPFPFQEEGEMEAAFVSGNCSALAGDLTRLVSTRQAFGPLASRYQLLTDAASAAPLVVSEDPLAAASRSNDPAFANIVRWTLEVLLQAEAHELNQQSIAATQAELSSHSGLLSSRNAILSSRNEAEGHASSANISSNPTVRILTGQTHEIGQRLGLDDDWAVRVLAAVGNYGELYERDLGTHSPLNLPRAQNRLVEEGGLQLPLPLK
ncbi:MAG: transporter substrate-binding domain-containing protein [Acidobacteriaceae bacterium]|nr:transporter substrate-binding domain-containing protein [Acidobacteriaceae bacterium]